MTPVVAFGPCHWPVNVPRAPVAQSCKRRAPLAPARSRAAALRACGARRRLREYDWPGNVRELRNVVERCVLLADGDTFPERRLHLDPTPDSTAEALENGDRLCLPIDGSLSFTEMERRIIAAALRRNDFNVSLTARAYGTTREKLRYRVRKYRLETSD